MNKPKQKTLFQSWSKKPDPVPGKKSTMDGSMPVDEDDEDRMLALALEQSLKDQAPEHYDSVNFGSDHSTSAKVLPKDNKPKGSLFQTIKPQRINKQSNFDEDFGNDTDNSASTSGATYRTNTRQTSNISRENKPTSSLFQTVKSTFTNEQQKFDDESSNITNDIGILEADFSDDMEFDDLDALENAAISCQLNNTINTDNIENLPGFDLDAGKLWIYPTNYPLREYQYNIVSEALFKNTMVVLPTGLGKTFIAAVVMYNFYRWYPQGKVVFMAPTKPLVAQQIEACFNIMGIPQEDTAEMTGAMQPAARKECWTSKRVFFLTPQVLTNDLTRGVCPAPLMKCLVVDEAHKALGNHAYCQVVRELVNYGKNFRILSLSATPGSDIKAVQKVLSNLLVAHIELRTEESPDIQQYSHERKVEKIVVPLGQELGQVKVQYIQILEVIVNRLKRQGVLYKKDVKSLSKFMMLKAREAFRQNPPHNLQRHQYGAVEGDFALCISLYHGYELLQLHGLRSLFNYLESLISGDKGFGRTKTELQKIGDFNDLMSTLKGKFQPIQPIPFSQQSPMRASQAAKPFAVGHPKMDKLKDIVLEHFRRFEQDGLATRIMIFSQYRDSVNEITELLNRHRPLVKVMSFIGQSSAGKSTKGFTQKEQLKVMKKFREGGYNTLVSTCVGEEGLDIGDVDLIICFDAHKSPIRLVQRMGRTGRKREGKIVMLVAEGKEEQIYNQSQYSKRSIHKAILNSAKTLHFYPENQRMVPEGLDPMCHKMHITTKIQFVTKGNSKQEKKSVSSAKTSKSTAVSGVGTKKTVSSKPVVSKDGFLTAEELQYWNDHFKVDDPVPSFTGEPSMLCLNKDEQMEPYPRGPMLSLDKWLPWQNTEQPTHTVSHSEHTKHLVQIVEFIDVQNAIGGDDDAYGLEMQTYLNDEDIIKPKPQNNSILKFCTQVETRKGKGKGKRQSRNLPDLCSEPEDMDTDDELPDLSKRTETSKINKTSTDTSSHQDNTESTTVHKESFVSENTKSHQKKIERKGKRKKKKKSMEKAGNVSVIHAADVDPDIMMDFEGEVETNKEKHEIENDADIIEIDCDSNIDSAGKAELDICDNDNVSTLCDKSDTDKTCEIDQGTVAMGDIVTNCDLITSPKPLNLCNETTNKSSPGSINVESNCSSNTTKRSEKLHEEHSITDYECDKYSELLPFYTPQKIVHAEISRHKNSNNDSFSVDFESSARQIKPPPSFEETSKIMDELESKGRLSPVDILELIDKWELEDKENIDCTYENNVREFSKGNRNTDFSKTSVPICDISIETNDNHQRANIADTISSELQLTRIESPGSSPGMEIDKTPSTSHCIEKVQNTSKHKQSSNTISSSKGKSHEPEFLSPLSSLIVTENGKGSSGVKSGRLLSPLSSLIGQEMNCDSPIVPESAKQQLQKQPPFPEIPKSKVVDTENINSDTVSPVFGVDNKSRRLSDAPSLSETRFQLECDLFDSEDEDMSGSEHITDLENEGQQTDNLDNGKTRVSSTEIGNVRSGAKQLLESSAAASSTPKTVSTLLRASTCDNNMAKTNVINKPQGFAMKEMPAVEKQFSDDDFNDSVFLNFKTPDRSVSQNKFESQPRASLVTPANQQQPNTSALTFTQALHCLDTTMKRSRSDSNELNSSPESVEFHSQAQFKANDNQLSTQSRKRKLSYSNADVSTCQKSPTLITLGESSPSLPKPSSNDDIYHLNMDGLNKDESKSSKEVNSSQGFAANASGITSFVLDVDFDEFDDEIIPPSPTSSQSKSQISGFANDTSKNTTVNSGRVYTLENSRVDDSKPFSSFVKPFEHYEKRPMSHEKQQQRQSSALSTVNNSTNQYPSKPNVNLNTNNISNTKKASLNSTGSSSVVVDMDDYSEVLLHNDDLEELCDKTNDTKDFPPTKYNPGDITYSEFMDDASFTQEKSPVNGEVRCSSSDTNTNINLPDLETVDCHALSPSLHHENNGDCSSPVLESRSKSKRSLTTKKSSLEQAIDINEKVSPAYRDNESADSISPVLESHSKTERSLASKCSKRPSSEMASENHRNLYTGSVSPDFEQNKSRNTNQINRPISFKDHVNLANDETLDLNGKIEVHGSKSTNVFNLPNDETVDVHNMEVDFEENVEEDDFGVGDDDLDLWEDPQTDAYVSQASGLASSQFKTPLKSTKASKVRRMETSDQESPFIAQRQRNKKPKPQIFSDEDTPVGSKTKSRKPQIFSDEDTPVAIKAKSKKPFLMSDDDTPILNKAKSRKPHILSDEDTPRTHRYNHKTDIIDLSMDSDEDFQDFNMDTSMSAKKLKSVAKSDHRHIDAKKKKKRRKGCGFLEEEAEMSDEECSSDESDDSNLDHLEASFINDCSQFTQQANTTDMRAIYMRSIRSPEMAPSKFKLKYDNNMDVFSQIPEEDDEDTYEEDSFCVEDDVDETEMSEFVERPMDVTLHMSAKGPRTRRARKLDMIREQNKFAKQIKPSKVKESKSHRRIKRLAQSSSDEDMMSPEKLRNFTQHDSSRTLAQNEIDVFKKPKSNVLREAKRNLISTSSSSGNDSFNLCTNVLKEKRDIPKLNISKDFVEDDCDSDDFTPVKSLKSRISSKFKKPVDSKKRLNVSGDNKNGKENVDNVKNRLHSKTSISEKPHVKRDLVDVMELNDDDEFTPIKSLKSRINGGFEKPSTVQAQDKHSTKQYDSQFSRNGASAADKTAKTNDNSDTTNQNNTNSKENLTFSLQEFVADDILNDLFSDDDDEMEIDGKTVQNNASSVSVAHENQNNAKTRDAQISSIPATCTNKLSRVSSPSSVNSKPSESIFKIPDSSFTSDSSRINSGPSKNNSLDTSRLSKEERLRLVKQKQEEFARKRKMSVPSEKSIAANKIDSSCVTNQGTTQNTQILNMTANVSRAPSTNGKLVILVDSREINGSQDLVSALRFKYNIDTRVKQLSGCDFIVSNRMGVERKLFTDFTNGGHRAKLQERVRHMVRLFERACIIVEKERVKPGEKEIERPLLKSKYVESMLSSLSQMNVKVLFSTGQVETAEILSNLCQVEQRKNMAISVDVNNVNSQNLDFYLSLPNISYITAVNLCYSFKSLQTFVCSSATLIAKRGFMNKEKAEEIFKYLRHKFNPQMLPTK